jgi:hypothetical protein
MKRRAFLSLLGVAAVAWPLAVRAQQWALVALVNLQSAEGSGRAASVFPKRLSAVTPEEFRTAYPKLQVWIQNTLAFYEKNAQPIASMHFVRLPLYFDHSLLETAKFIAVDQLPMPPLSAMGLSRFAAFEHGNFNGVTYLDRYFIKRTLVTEEALHFHELIHVIQWRLLGPEGFLAAYANGLDEYGYENSPLEKMAYDAEALFERSSAVFDAGQFVAEQLGHLR